MLSDRSRKLSRTPRKQQVVAVVPETRRTHRVRHSGNVSETFRSNLSRFQRSSRLVSGALGRTQRSQPKDPVGLRVAPGRCPGGPIHPVNFTKNVKFTPYGHLFEEFTKNVRFTFYVKFTAISCRKKIVEDYLFYGKKF